MTTKKYIIVAISVVMLYGVYFYWTTWKKDQWAKENPSVKYSEERERDVWGKILRGRHSALFYGTPLYDIADEISGFDFLNNQAKVERLIEELPSGLVNFKEDKFGISIGHFALYHQNYKALRLLLDKGLNPNILTKDGKALMLEINSLGHAFKPEGLQMLHYLIKKGGNVNLLAGTFRSHTPLTTAAQLNLEHVKVLIKAGADPHFVADSTLQSSFCTALSSALAFRQIEIANYLIFEQKADFKILK